MPAVWINIAFVLAGSLIGLLLKDRFTPRMGRAVMSALGLCTIAIGMKSALASEDGLCLILCMVAGTLLGDRLDLEGRMDSLGELLRVRVLRGKGGGGFAQGFATATVLFCVGAMSINGSLQAGLNSDYTILEAKSVMDGLSAIPYAAAMGVGVAFSAVPILLYEGGLVLLAGAVRPLLGPAVVTEMSAVGGVIILAIAFNVLELPKKKLPVVNMLPAIFLPLIYLPIVHILETII